MQNYLKTGNKTHKDTGKNAVINDIKNYDTKYILIGLLKKHKFELSVVLNIVFLIYFFVPFLPSEIISLISN